jgi:hypothetical protein
VQPPGEHFIWAKCQCEERGDRTVTLYAVQLQPGHRARPSYDDFTRQYRDLDADRAAGRTAHRTIATLEQLDQEERQQLEAAELDQNLNRPDVRPDGKTKMQGSTESHLVSNSCIHALKQWAVPSSQINLPLKGSHESRNRISR